MLNNSGKILSQSIDYSVLVNSSDGFEDCWDPFFTLFSKYWPDCNAPIFLNTEKKRWEYSQLNIHCTVVQGESANRLTWSECLMAALEQIKTPLVVYFQEDYFIHQPVRHDVISTAVNYMKLHDEVKHIALTQHGSLGPHEEYGMKDYLKIRQNAKYRISTQAALWRVDTLKSYLQSEENGWMFEIFGTFRSLRRNELFLCANYAKEDGGPAIDYLHTGIIKGKWLPSIRGVFAANGIVIDFEKRGFYKSKHPFIRKFLLLVRLLERPKYLFRAFFN
jgi:hypothetical protein